MKKLIMVAGSAALMANVAIADNHEEAEDMVGRMYIEYVKPEMRSDYESVISDWNDCIAEADSEMHWHVYRPETGDLGRYAYSIGDRTWADFDKETPELDACYQEFKERYYASVYKVHGSFDIYMDEHSHHVDDDVDRPIAMVTVFDLDDPRAFLENVKKYTEAAGENEWKDPYYFYSGIGGEGATGLYVVSPVENFSDFDGDNGFWKMLSDHFGEEEFEKMREQDRAAINSYYTDIWKRDDELSSSHD